MSGWPIWIMFSAPLYVALTDRLAGHARFLAFWVYSWLVAAFLAFTTWRFDATWHGLAPDGYPTPLRLVEQHRDVLWANGFLVVGIMALPFILYRGELRRQSGAIASPPAV